MKLWLAFSRRILIHFALLYTVLTSRAEVSFKNEIAPVLEKKCLVCHSPEKKKGDYQLQSYEAFLKPGKSKDVPITPGKPEESKLYQLIIASDPDDRMPQKDEALPQESVEKIRKWILEGAKFDGENPSALLADVIPDPAPQPAPEKYSHPIPVAALAFNPGSDEIVVGGYRELTVWGATDGHLIRRVGGMPQRVQTIAFGPDGLLAVGGGQPGKRGEVLLIDNWSTLPKPAKLGRGADLVLVIRFTPDGQTVAWTGTDNAIHIAETISRKEKLLIQQHADWVLDLNFNMEGTKLVSASRDRSARIYDVKTGELEATYTGHEGPVNTAVFAPDSKHAISGGRDKKVHFWNVKDGTGAGELGSCEGEILRLRVQSNEVFVASNDNLVRQFSLSEKRLVRTFEGPAQTPYDLALGGTNWLAAGYFSGEVQVWNLTNGMPVSRFMAAPGKKRAFD